MANAAFGTPGGVGYIDPFQPQPAAAQSTPAAPSTQPTQVAPPASQPTQMSIPMSGGYTAQPQTTPTTQAPIGSQPTQPPTQTTQPTAQTTQVQQPLVMPANGSVVDLLNSQGEDSSQAARQKLAASYGIKGYDFSASKNTELAQKYIDAHNQLKTTTQQDNGGAARATIQNAIQENQAATEQDAQKTMYDVVASMNPVEKQLFDVTQQALSSVGTQQFAAEEYTKAFADVNNPAGIPGESLSQEQLQLVNWKKIMDGTEDDIREEVTKAGGFATESQVAAMTVARNKTLLKQASYLQQSMALKQDYVDNLMRYSQIDRETAEKQVDRKIGLAQSLVTMTDKIDNAAKDNYQKIVNEVGYKGLAESFATYSQGKSQAEKLLGLPQGALSNQAWLAATTPAPTNQPASVQEYEYAKKNGFTGTFSQYQNEDANRKASIAKAGATTNGLTPSNISTTVNQIAASFDNEPVVRNYNVVAEGYNFAKSLIAKDKPTSADNIGLVYAFAKAMDPNSVVREGEYATVQKYAQSWAQAYGFKAERILANTEFLTKAAQENLVNTIKSKYDASKTNYDNVYKEYQRRVEQAKAGGFNSITDYSQAYASIPPTKGTTQQYNGYTYISDGTQWVLKK